MADNNFSRIFNSSLGMIFGFIVSGAVGLLTRIVLGRVLQPEKYGMLSEGLAVLNFFVILSLLGTSGGIARFKSFGDTFYNTISSALVVCFPVSILSSVLVFVFSGFLASILGNPGLEPVFKVFSFNIPAIVLMGIFVSVFRGNKKTKERVLISDIIVPVSILVFSILFVFIVAETAELAALGYTVASWIGAFFAGLLVLRNGNRFELPSFESIKELLEFSSPLMLSGLFAFGFTWLNILLLGFLIGSESAGLYNAAYPLTFAMAAILTSVNYLFLPVATTVYSKEKFGELKSLYHTVSRWLVVTSLPILAVMVFKPEFIITTLFGSSYADAAALLVILAFARFTNIVFGPIGQTLIAVGKTRQELISKGLGFIVLLVLSVYLITEIGLIGAGIGYLAGTITSNLLRLFFARRTADFNPFNRDILKPLFAFAVSIPVLIFVSGHIVFEIISIGAYGIIYLLILVSTKPFKEEDLKVLEGLEVGNEFVDHWIERIRKVLEKWFKE